MSRFGEPKACQGKTICPWTPSPESGDPLIAPMATFRTVPIGQLVPGRLSRLVNGLFLVRFLPGNLAVPVQLRHLHTQRVLYYSQRSDWSRCRRWGDLQLDQQHGENHWSDGHPRQLRRPRRRRYRELQWSGRRAEIGTTDVRQCQYAERHQHGGPRAPLLSLGTLAQFNRTGESGPAPIH
jgi:hypothetical protein